MDFEEEVLADCERLLGDDHPWTLISRGNLAYRYRYAGRVADAIDLEVSVLAERARVLGSEHPDTRTARANLAASYRQAGRMHEALELETVLNDSKS